MTSQPQVVLGHKNLGYGIKTGNIGISMRTNRHRRGGGWVWTIVSKHIKDIKYAKSTTG